MKISHRKITASNDTSSIQIPAPFDQFYDFMTDEEYEAEFDYPAHPSPCEEADGYSIEFISYVKAKPEFQEELQNDGLDIVELVKEGDDTFLGYTVHDMVYSVDPTELPDNTSYEEYEEAGYLDDIESTTYVQSSQFNPGDHVKINFGIYSDKEGTIIEEVPAAQIADADPGRTYYSVMLDGPGYDDDYIVFSDKDMTYVFNPEDVDACSDVIGAIDTGLDYWYYGRHGLGPGTIPQGVTVLDTVEEGWKTWMKLDKMLTTEELNYYDLKEEWPPEGSITHNGDEITGCDNIMGTEDIEAKGRPERYADASDRLPFGPEAGSRNSSAFYKGFKIVMNAVDKLWDIFDRAGRIVEEGFTTKDEAINYIQDAGLVAASEDAEGEPITAAACTRVAEDEDSISYVIESTDINARTIARYKNYKIMSNPDVGGFDILTLDNELVDSPFTTEREAREYIDNNLSDAIMGAEEVEEEENFLLQPDQEFASAETAINGKQGKLPAVFSKAAIPEGALVLDYGGGTVESEAVAQNYLDQFGATEMLYDPYNQTAEHNKEVVKVLRQNGGADVAVCSNVLNVIKEEEVRIDLLNKIKKLLKSGATAYISVYEGSGRNEGSATQKGKSFQNNRKLAGYLEEVQTVFPDAIRKGAVIIAPNTAEVAASTEVSAAISINNIDLTALEQEIKEGCEAYLTGPYGGFLPTGSPKEDRWDITADEIYSVDVKREDDPEWGDRIKIEVRAELDYDGMSNLAEELNPIVANYDEDAYFDQEEPGIMTAYIYETDSINGTTEITADRDADNEKNLAAAHEDWLRPEEYDDEDIAVNEPVDVEIPLDCDVTVQEDGAWAVEDPNPIEEYGEELSWHEEDGISIDRIDEDFGYILEWHIPAGEGQYHITGKLILVYDFNEDGKPSLNTKASHVEDLDVVGPKKIESNIVLDNIQPIVAAMTEEELDAAIEEGRPFDIDDFKKYKTPVDEDAVLAENVEVGDVIDLEHDASEVNLGTVVRILAINDPGEDWVDYTYRVQIVRDPGGQSLQPGDIIDIHFDTGEALGYILPV